MVSKSLKALPLTALVVDDVEENRLLFAAYLQQAGFEITLTAANSSQAVSIIKNNKTNIDLILLDIRLPDVDGLKLCKVLRSEPTCADLPIFVLTSLNNVEDWDRAYDAGATDYLVKPISLGKCRFLKRLAQSLKEFRILKAQPKSSEVIEEVSPETVFEEIQRRYGETLETALSRRTQNNNDSDFSVLFISPGRLATSHNQMQKVLRQVLLSAVSYQGTRLLSRADCEFMIVLPKDGVMRADQWLSQIKLSQKNAAFESSGETGIEALKSVIYTRVSLRPGEALSAAQFITRISDDIATQRKLV